MIQDKFQAEQYSEFRITANEREDEIFVYPVTHFHKMKFIKTEAVWI